MIIGCFEAVCEESDWSCLIVQNEEFFRSLGIVYQKYLLSITTPENNRNEVLKSLYSCVGWPLLLFINSLNLIHVK